MSATLIESAANFAKMSIGCGIFTLPLSTIEAGFIPALLLNVLIASWNYLSCCKLLDCYELIGTKGIYIPPSIKSELFIVAYGGFGELGSSIVSNLMIATLIGVVTSYQVAFAGLVQDISQISLSTSQLTLLSTLVIYPLACVKDVGVLAPVSVLALVFLSLSMIIIMYYGFANLHSNPAVFDSTDFPAWPTSVSGFSSFVADVTFCYCMMIPLFPVLKSLKNKKDILPSLLLSLIFCWLIYALLSLSGVMYEYWTTLQSNILLNLPQSSFSALCVRIFMSVVFLFSAPLILIVPSEMIEKYLMYQYPALVDSSTETKSSRNRSWSEYFRGMKWPLLQSSRAQSSTTYSSIELGDRGNNVGQDVDSSTAVSDKEMNSTARCITRAILLVISTSLALILPCFGSIIAILGSFTIAGLSFILPPALHLKMITIPALDNNGIWKSSSDALTNFFFDCVLLVSGVALMVFATVQTIFKVMATIQETGHC